MKKVKPGFKIFLIAIVLIGLAFVAKTFLIPSKGSDSSNSESSTFGNIFKGGGKVYTIGVNTYAGFSPILYLNNGLEPNEDCIFYKDYGVKVKIIIQDDFLAGRAAFKKGSIDMIYCTADAFCIEKGEGQGMDDARHFMMLNWSRGSDAIVVNKNINTVADLKGKRIAFAEGTASHSLLINTLETNNLHASNITLVRVNNGEEAAKAFKALQVDACVTWSPDDMDCVDAVSGSKVLMSTKQATNIICDGLIIRETTLEKNREDVEKIVSAILYANSLMNEDQSVVTKASQLFAKHFGTDVDFCKDGIGNIRFATLGDNANFYGLNSSYTGVKGDDLYSKMSRIYTELSLVSNPVSWRKASDPSIIEKLYSKGSVKGNQEAEKDRHFTPAPKEIENKPAISNKKVTINFGTNSALLDGTARTIIDREFVNIAKQFSNTRIRVEGNTDNTGDKQYNVKLSYDRANSVVNYLVKEYGFDRNRFIIVGNGPKHAIDDGVTGSSENYRSTDFQLITE